MSNNYESDDYDDSGSFISDESFSEDDLSGNEDVEFSDEDEGYDVPTQNATQFWKAPIRGVSVSFGGATPASKVVYAPQPSFTPQITVPQPLTLEILPSPQVQPITFETIGRNFIVRSTPGLLAPYSTYLENIRGKYDEATNTWTFSQRQEAQVRNLLTQIATGQLPPPNELPLPNPQQVSIDVNVVGELPIRTMAPPASVAPETPVAPTIPQTRPQMTPAPPIPTMSQLPSQIIQATMPTSIIQPVPSTTVVKPAQLPPFDPLAKEPTESQQEYDRRIQLYQHLVNLGVAPESSNLLARMRNQVDIYGVVYEPSAMQILNTYLPISPS